jgi:hypothetical protein
MFGHRKNQKHGGLWLYVDFNLVKLRLASLKAYSASASGSHTRAKTTCRCHQNGFDKDLFYRISRCLQLFAIPLLSDLLLGSNGVTKVIYIRLKIKYTKKLFIEQFENKNS